MQSWTHTLRKWMSSKQPVIHVYYKGTGEHVFYMGVYVDDILTGRTDTEIKEVKGAFSKAFKH